MNILLQNCSIFSALTMQIPIFLQAMSHPFSSLNNSLGFTGGKHYQKITIPV